MSTITVTRFDVTNAPVLSGGAECRVFETEDGSVLKVYLYQDDAQFACEKQGIANELGLAPKVLSDVGRVEGTGELDYGYVSERAEVFTNPMVFDSMLETDEGELFQKKVRNLCSDNAGNLNEVINQWNTGIIDGKLVLLDFGEISLGISGVVL